MSFTLALQCNQGEGNHVCNIGEGRVTLIPCHKFCILHANLSPPWTFATCSQGAAFARTLTHIRPFCLFGVRTLTTTSAIAFSHFWPKASSLLLHLMQYTWHHLVLSRCDVLLCCLLFCFLCFLCCFLFSCVVLRCLALSCLVCLCVVFSCLVLSFCSILSYIVLCCVVLCCLIAMSCSVLYCLGVVLSCLIAMSCLMALPWIFFPSLILSSFVFVLVFNFSIRGSMHHFNRQIMCSVWCHVFRDCFCADAHALTCVLYCHVLSCLILSCFVPSCLVSSGCTNRGAPAGQRSRGKKGEGTESERVYPLDASVSLG